MNRIFLAGLILFPICWQLLAFAQAVQWPQLTHGQPGAFWTTVVLAVLVSLSVRFRLWNVRDNFTGWTSDIAIILLGFCGLLVASAAGFWTLDNQVLSALGEQLAHGDNPYVVADSFVAPLVSFAGALVYHWLPLQPNLANALWASLIGLSALSASAVAIWGASGQNQHGIRALLLVASPFLVLWGVGGMHTVVLAYPFVVMAMLFSSRAWGVAAGFSLAFAAAVHPIFFALTLPLLLPGPLNKQSGHIALTVSFRAIAALGVASGILYAPLLAAWAQGGDVSVLQWLSEPQDILWLGSIQQSVWHIVGAVALFGIGATALAQAIQVWVNARRPDNSIDVRARAAVWSLLFAILILPQVPAFSVLLILPLLARTPNLAFSLVSVALALTSLTAVSSEGLLAHPLAPIAMVIAAIVFGTCIELVLTHLSRSKSAATTG